jgi:low affinity Fe/Cu permease
MKPTASNSRTSLSQPKACFGLSNGFRVCAHWLSLAVGTPAAFVLALAAIVIWAVLGPVFRFSDTWQLVINTGTTIVTFLMVFVIQNTQNRDTKALHLKLDELLRGVAGARTSLVDLENLSDEELDRLQREFERLRTASANTTQTPADEKGRRKVRRNG